MLSKFKKKVPEWVVNLTVVASLFFVYCYVLPLFIPSGINANVMTRVYKILSPVLIFYFLIFSIFFPKKLLPFIDDINKNSGKVKFSDSVLLFLPMTPIIQYAILNHEIMGMSDMIALLLFFLAVSAVFIFLIPILLSSYSCNRAVLSFNTAFFLFLIWLTWQVNLAGPEQEVSGCCCRFWRRYFS